MRVKLPADVAIDPEVELYTGSDGYFLKARLNVSKIWNRMKAVAEANQFFTFLVMGFRGSVATSSDVKQ
jgi:hypothetical protein